MYDLLANISSVLVFVSPSAVSITSSYLTDFIFQPLYPNISLCFIPNLTSSAVLPDVHRSLLCIYTCYIWVQARAVAALHLCLQASSTAVMKTKQTLLIGVPDSRKLD